MSRANPVVATVLGALLLCASASAADLSKRYPEFAARKDSLGGITLLVESAVLIDVDGDVKRVDLADSRRLGESAASGFREALAARGYPVERVVVASMGCGLDSTARFTLVEGPAAPAAGDSSAVSPAPFYLDSSLAGRPEVGAAWGSLCRRLLGYERRNNRPPDVVREPVTLGDSLGARVVGVVIVKGWNVPTGKQFRQGLLTGVLSGGMLVAHKVSVTRLQFALVDARSGEILWSDAGFWQARASDKIVQSFTASAVKALP